MADRRPVRVRARSHRHLPQRWTTVPRSRRCPACRPPPPRRTTSSRHLPGSSRPATRRWVALQNPPRRVDGAGSSSNCTNPSSKDLRSRRQESASESTASEQDARCSMRLAKDATAWAILSGKRASRRAMPNSSPRRRTSGRPRLLPVAAPFRPVAALDYPAVQPFRNNCEPSSQMLKGTR